MARAGHEGIVKHHFTRQLSRVATGLGVVCLAMALFAASARAETLALREDHPDRYVVRRGDTLWDISGHFLTQPWRWPEIWGVNPQVSNPHLIYPGDVLHLIWTADGPRLTLDGAGGNGHLSPEVRITPITDPIPALPLHRIRQFLEEAIVIRDDDLRHFPYIVEGDDARVVNGGGDFVYARHAVGKPGQLFDIFRLGEPYVDPDTGEHLGYAALHVADGELLTPGDPAQVHLKRARREVLPRDVLIPEAARALTPNFYPHPPGTAVAGTILAVVDGVSQIGQYNVVVLNRGRVDGLEAGHVLAVSQHTRSARDPVDGDMVMIEGQDAGHLMLFHVFERVSYALVMNASRPIHVHDEVRTP